MAGERFALESTPILCSNFHLPRQFEAIEGLRSALDSGETYDAALLDSVHTAEHVLQEFEYASQLVCRGGLILIHDATWPYGTVGAALDEIDRRGYGVTRLWTAESAAHRTPDLDLQSLRTGFDFGAESLFNELPTSEFASFRVS